MNRVACDCTRYSVDEGNVTGAGSLWFVEDANGSLLQFGSTVWHGPVPDTGLTAGDALQVMRETYAAQGLNTMSFEGADLMLLSDHGLVWRVWALAQAEDRGVQAQWMMDAVTGEVVAAEERPTTGTATPPSNGRPWLLPAVLVATAAIVLVAYRSGRRADDGGFVLPDPPRFEDEE